MLLSLTNKQTLEQCRMKTEVNLTVRSREGYLQLNSSDKILYAIFLIKSSSIAFCGNRPGRSLPTIFLDLIGPIRNNQLILAILVRKTWV